jgi:hypothetical protein
MHLLLFRAAFGLIWRMELVSLEFSQVVVVWGGLFEVELNPLDNRLVGNWKAEGFQGL